MHPIVGNFNSNISRRVGRCIAFWIELMIKYKYINKYMLGGTERQLEIRMIIYIRGEAITYRFGVDPHRWNNNSNSEKGNVSVRSTQYEKRISSSKIIEQMIDIDIDIDR